MMKRFAQALLLAAASSAFLIWRMPEFPRAVRAQPSSGQAFFIGSPPGGIGAACASNVGYLTAAGQVVTCVSSVWTVATGGGGGSPGGSNGQVQYNSSGSFGGASNTSLDSSGNLQALTMAAGTGGSNSGQLVLGAGSDDLSGTPANAFGWIGPTSGTGQHLMRAPSAAAAANQILLFGAESSHVSTPAYANYALWAYAYQSTGQTINSGAQRTLAFDTNASGSSTALHDPSTQNTRFKADVTGFYMGFCGINATNSSDAINDFFIGWKLNGGSDLPSSFYLKVGTAAWNYVQPIGIHLTAGDYVECVVQPPSNGSTNSGATGTYVYWERRGGS